MHNSIEYFRTAWSLVPQSTNAPIARLILPNAPNAKPRRFCSCSRGKTPNCTHIKHLDDAFAIHGSCDLWRDFRSGFFAHLFSAVARHDSTQIKPSHWDYSQGNISGLRTAHGHQQVIFRSPIAEADRLSSRLNASDTYSRHSLIIGMLDYVLTENESAFFRSDRLTAGLEEDLSVWMRLALHCHREWTPDQTSIVTAIDDTTGELLLDISHKEAHLSVRLPPSVLIDTVTFLEKNRPDAAQFKRDITEYEILFDIAISEKTVTGVPVLRGSPFSEAHAYGSWYFDRTSETFVRLAPASIGLASRHLAQPFSCTRDALSLRLEKDPETFSIPSTTDSIDLFATATTTDLSRITGSPILRAFSSSAIEPLTEQGDWCTVRVRYSQENHTVDLADLLATRETKRRYCIAADGTNAGVIIDTHAEAIARTLTTMGRLSADGVVTMHRASILRFAQEHTEASVFGSSDIAERLRSLATGVSRTPLGPISGFSASLRPYQHAGVEWLLYLCDSGLGGRNSGD